MNNTYKKVVGKTIDKGTKKVCKVFKGDQPAKKKLKKLI